MFTGIVTEVGVIKAATSVPGGQRLQIDIGSLAEGCVLGASICVSGACLTVSDLAGTTASFDAITETLKRSTLGSRRVGDRVNLEPALRLSDRLDGHYVQGHIDGTAKIDRIIASDREHVIWLKTNDALGPYLVPKGSVAIDGISLTIAEAKGSSFSVAIIPTTLDRTTLPALKAGDAVNIETDILTRTVVHWLSRMSDGKGLTWDALKEAGFA